MALVRVPGGRVQGAQAPQNAWKFMPENCPITPIRYKGSLKTPRMLVKVRSSAQSSKQ